MQKLDFSEHILQLKQFLKSEEIVHMIDALPLSQAVPQLKDLTSFIIQSKSNYDQSLYDSQKHEILNSLQSEELYSQTSIGNLITTIVQTSVQNSTKQQLFTNSLFLKFYSFHAAILTIDSICQKVLFHNSIESLYSEDVVIFKILSENTIELQKLNQIILNLKDLIETILTIYQNKNEKITVELLDSGSGVNVALKTTVDTAKSLFQIFKEIWDWLMNRKFYKNNLHNAGLMDNLNVMMAIKDAKEKGAITEEEAKIYKEKIIRRTEDLLELNVAPKQLIEESNENNTRRILLEFTETKMLENKND